MELSLEIGIQENLPYQKLWLIPLAIKLSIWKPLLLLSKQAWEQKMSLLKEKFHFLTSRKPVPNISKIKSILVTELNLFLTDLAKKLLKTLLPLQSNLELQTLSFI